MKKHLVSLLAATGLALAWSGSANAVVIDFEDIAVAYDSHTTGTSFSSGGFVFANIGAGHIDVSDYHQAAYAENGGQYLFTHGSGYNLSMTDPGDTFSLNSFDGAEFFSNVNTNASFITVVGSLFGGGTISQTFTLDGVIDGLGGAADFESFTLASGFTGLTSVSFSANGSFSLDNIEVNAVPAPASVLLLGFGLLGLARLQRRK